MRIVRVVLVLFMVGAVALASAGVAVRWLRQPVAPPTWANDYDVTAQPPDAIAPGTHIDTGPPAGWSHLVIKSLPRVRADQVSKLPDNAIMGRDRLAGMVSWMFTAFAADVVPERQGAHTRYRLRAIGLGLGTAVDGRDTILTVETDGQHGPKLDFFQKEILSTGYQIQRQAVVAVHGPSFALLDTPVTFRCGDTHRTIRYRYALLVDSVTGRLDVLLWRLGGEGGECGDLTRAVLLHPNTVDVAELIPDLGAFNALGIPSSEAFAVDKLPDHRLEVPIPPELAPLAGKTRFTPDDAHALESGLRKLLPPS